MPNKTVTPVIARPPLVADCARLDVFRIAVEFQLLAAQICRTRGIGALRNQLDRASVSIVLNVAEGAGRFAPAEKAHFYLIARGSATECVAAVELLRLRGLIVPGVVRRADALLHRIVAMLTGLARRMQEGPP